MTVVKLILFLFQEHHHSIEVTDEGYLNCIYESAFSANTK